MTRVIGACIAAALLLALGFGAGWEYGGGREDEGPSAADIGFAQDMAVHHEQAVQMSRIAQSRVDAPLDVLAAQIIENQQREIGMMRGWLMMWDAPQLPSGPAMTWMEGHHGDHVGGGPMPGMASTAELQELSELDGRQLEVRFLQLMIRHHRGGVEMAAAAADLATSPAVRSVAQLMATDQGQEIAYMLPLLGARGGDELA